MKLLTDDDYDALCDLPIEERLTMLRQRVHWWNGADETCFESMTGTILVEPANETTNLYSFGSEADFVFFRLWTAHENQGTIRDIRHVYGDEYFFLLESFPEITDKMRSQPLHLPLKGLDYDEIDEDQAVVILDDDDDPDDFEAGRLYGPSLEEHVDQQVEALDEAELEGFYHFDDFSNDLLFELESDRLKAFRYLFEYFGETAPNEIPDSPEVREWGKEIVAEEIDA